MMMIYIISSTPQKNTFIFFLFLIGDPTITFGFSINSDITICSSYYLFGGYSIFEVPCESRDAPDVVFSFMLRLLLAFFR